MRWTCALAMMAMMLPLNSSASDGWINGDGKALTETDAMKSSGGFAASLLVTSDADWRAKWATPPETTPGFNEANEVHLGGELFLLTFLSNPQLDENRVPKVHCDLRMLRPDGSTSIDERDVPCFTAALTGPPNLLYMTNLHLKFVAEAGDPKGTWTAQVVVRDLLRKVSLPLQARFDVR
ncbi:hypothetical protein [Stenotrophomonas maltophilia]|uniref:hypothetical protein n=1 Tax=Stenotrophomonas maltophilia TaxID=40324 RepID=UPI001D12B924|nr:hypothetical protein [Stenotrophomonas maltophilia]UXB35264.1 hypothetical protein K7563_15225 [Stenotrophomonas maltophilia]